MARSLTGVVLKDKWTIDGLLGEGGVAAVYAATHRNGKRVALKVLHPHLASIEEVRDRFLREGYVANRVDHPGAVGVLDDDVTDDGLVFLVMELLDGESLDRRVQREGRLPAGDVLAITDLLLDVLAAAHDKGILHRDIKPENVFALRNGRIKLLDFGIARLHEQQAASKATQTGSAMGTPAYMPAEQARGRWDEVDARTDLWAVGATMYSLLVGRCVHEAETVNETLLLAMMRAAAPLVSVWPEAPDAVASIVDRALAFDREGRWPDAKTMQQAVREAMALPGLAAATPAALSPTLLSTTSVSRPQPTPAAPAPRGTLLAGTMTPAPVTPRPPASWWRRSRTAIGAAAAAVGVLGAVLLLATGRSHTEPPPTPAALTTPAVPTETASVSLAPPPSVSFDPPSPPPAAASTTAFVALAPARGAAPLRLVPSGAPVAPRPVAPTSNPLERRK